jgi:hypothetical protein
MSEHKITGAIRNQLKNSKEVRSRQQMQLDKIAEFVERYGEPMERLFNEAERLKKSYELAAGTMKAMELEADRRFWQNLYINDSAKYIEVLSHLSKYMYSTIKQIEIKSDSEEMPVLQVRVMQ